MFFIHIVAFLKNAAYFYRHQDYYSLFVIIPLETTMNKTDLINTIAERTGSTKTEIRCLLDEILEEISDRLADGEKETLSGFGTFTVTEKLARTGINPRTKELIVIPPHRMVKFRTGNDLQDRVTGTD